MRTSVSIGFFAFTAALVAGCSGGGGGGTPASPPTVPVQTASPIGTQSPVTPPPASPSPMPSATPTAVPTPYIELAGGATSINLLQIGQAEIDATESTGASGYPHGPTLLLASSNASVLSNETCSGTCTAYANYVTANAAGFANLTFTAPDGTTTTYPASVTLSTYTLTASNLPDQSNSANLVIAWEDPYGNGLDSVGEPIALSNGNGQAQGNLPLPFAQNPLPIEAEIVNATTQAVEARQEFTTNIVKGQVNPITFTLQGGQTNSSVRREMRQRP